MKKNEKVQYRTLASNRKYYFLKEKNDDDYSQDYQLGFRNMLRFMRSQLVNEKF